MRDTDVQYVVDTEGQCIAVLLPVEEYEHYLDLLQNEADSQDPELAERLAQAAAQSTTAERRPLRDQLSQRGIDDVDLLG